MAKKSGFFSWFNKGKEEPQTEAESPTQTEQADGAIVNEQTTEAAEAQEQSTEQSVVETSVNVEPEETEQTADPEQAAQAGDQPNVVESKTNIAAENEDPAVETVSEVSDQASEPQVELTSQEAEATGELSQSGVEDKPEVKAVEQSKSKLGFFERLKRGLSKTRQQIGGGFLSLFKGKEIDDELYEELETQLLMADVGMDTTVKLIDRLTEHADRNQLKDADALYDLLKTEMSAILKKSDAPLVPDNSDGPFVILMVGVNGVGKTTTIGKMAKQFQQQGKSVMLAAGDTFRAAAVEQLQVWGDRNDVPVIAQHTGADSASVIFDAYQAAKARNVDVLIADTAGRLQNKDNLMQELEKIVRVLKKFDANIPHEIMLTIDATTGQNAISQTKIFNEAVGLTGISLTKLDGTAKGGVIFAVAEQFEIPIRYIGVGEGIEDLRTFEHQSFIDALFDEPA